MGWDGEITDRWKKYFEKLYSEGHVIGLDDLQHTIVPKNIYVMNIRALEVKMALII